VLAHSVLDLGEVSCGNLCHLNVSHVGFVDDFADRQAHTAVLLVHRVAFDVLEGLDVDFGLVNLVGRDEILALIFEAGDPDDLPGSVTVAEIVADYAVLSVSCKLSLVLLIEAVEDNDFVLTL